MILDANTFKLELTPEAALGILQKEVQRRGWRKLEVTEIRLVYTPYWVFSFDVLADSSVPTGRAALNAATGELDEFVPVLLDRPLKKTKEAEGQAEVETTAISKSEAEKVAPVKVAAGAGIKKDNVTVSALTKIYVPAFRIWVTVEGAGDFKVNVDAMLGMPSGAEQIPSREKTWDEATGETLDRMKTPSGIASLAGEAAGGVAGGGLLKNKPIVWVVMLIAIVALLYFAAGGQKGAETACTVEERYLGAKQYLNLLGEQYLKPSKTHSGELFVKGTCTFKARGGEDAFAMAKITLVQDGVKTGVTNSTSAMAKGGSQLPVEKEFSLYWNGTLTHQYAISVS